jgi:hypothetical protein
MALNFNVGPYFDDFDPSKNFHRILFKPGSAVQARELTQSQTILQNQISNFASAIYSTNTPISGGQVTINQNCYFIKLNPTFNGITITASNFAGTIIQDTTGTILAKVLATAETTSSGTTVGDPPTLIVSYLSGAQFTDASVIATTQGTTYYASVANSVANSPSTGRSSVASISSGIFYVINGYSVSDLTGIKYSIGNFVQVDPQTIILDKYDSVPSYRIGLQITETIYDYINDSSLLDPAIGASNYQAPGADRYVITLSLITLPLTLGSDDGFIELVRIENGNVIKQVDGTVYSTIDDYFAKRDYETNGDYIVDDFKLTSSANTISNSTYDLSVSKGIAYVHGYRVENQSSVKLTNDRAQSVANVNNNAVYADYGNYFVTDTANGVFDITTMPQVDLHCVGASSIVSTNNVTYNSTLVGTAFMRNMVYVSGTGTNTKTYVFNSYVSDFSANTLSGNVASGTTNSFTINDTNGSFSAVANAYFNVTVTMNTGGIIDVRNITNYTTGKQAYVYNPFTVTPTSSSTFSLSFANYDVESIVKTSGSGSYALTANTNINAAFGKVNGIGTSDTIYYSPVAPELIFPVGYPYVAQLISTSYFTQRVYRQKSFTGSTLTIQSTSGNSSNPLRFEGTGTLSSSAAEQLFIVIDNSTGSVLDFTTSGNTISISSDKTQATFTVGAGVATNKNVTIIAQVQASSADSSSYVLKSKSLVTGNTTTVGSLSSVSTTNALQDLSKGQIAITKTGISSSAKMSLYVNDVKRIVKVIDSGVAGTNPTGLISNYTDITSYFTLDNGQRDNFYDHASISLLPGAPVPTGNILVVVDYYSHTQASSGDGYFSIQSYNTSGSTYGGVSSSAESYAQIGTYTSKGGTQYKLRDCIDFRPCRVNSQTAYVWEYSGTQTSTNDIGMLIPNNLSNFTSFYQYYLGRKDKLLLTKDKSLQIIQGTPSINPLLPNEPSGSLVLANLTHDPYTAYVPGEAPAGTTSNLSINKVIHKRWAKNDITDLESRINNLEYYTSLSILENKASSLQIPDANGLNRFKNGILVDDFSSFGTADTNNPDYAININVRKNQLTALQVVNNFQLQNPVVLSTLGTLSDTNSYKINSINGAQTNLFTLPYTVTNVIKQPLASSVVSVNPFSVIEQEGILELNPPMDNWVDNNQAPAILITDPNFQVYQASGGVNLLNSGDYQTIPGTLTTKTGDSKTSVTTSGASTTTFTQTTTQTYASQLQNTLSSSYNPTSSTFGINNGYLTNIAVLPYIRPQQVIIRASGLLVNSSVSTFFDGVDVSRYLTTPNIIEVSNVSGTFSEDDIVGFFVNNTPYPLARVISVYKYADTTKVRLYVADIVTAPNAIGTTSIRNMFFDVNGNYASTTASGTIPSSGVITTGASGSISGVGGGWANTLNSSTTTNYFLSPIVQGYSTLLNQYGVWGDSTNSTNFNWTVPLTIKNAGTYTIEVGSSGSATFYANGVSIGTSLTNTPASTTTFTYTVATAPATVNIGWAATSSGTTTSSVAMTIKNSSGTIISSSVNPPVTYTNAGTAVIMPTGGEWFVGATQLRLDPSTASNISNFYVGATINIKSKYVYSIEQSATYVAPPPAPSGAAAPSGGGGGHCCVVATALTDGGDWHPEQKNQLVNWSINTLDKYFLGERLHRGYHVVASTVLPFFFGKDSKTAKSYAKWSFTNATNMIQGKKFNPISIPNSAMWITVMLVSGLVVSKEYAETKWKSLYK